VSGKRLGWDAYFLRIASIVAERSTCLRAKVGAVIVRDRNIIATGYNGSPAGLPHCLEVGCLLYTSTDPDGNVEENCFRTIHAEINAIAQAAKHGSMIAGGDLYITHSPCIHCLKVLLNVGVQRICYGKPYKIERAEAMLEGLPARLVRVEPE
jgi:dCMP deaminase